MNSPRYEGVGAQSGTSKTIEVSETATRRSESSRVCHRESELCDANFGLSSVEEIGMGQQLRTIGGIAIGGCLLLGLWGCWKMTEPEQSALATPSTSPASSTSQPSSSPSGSPIAMQSPASAINPRLVDANTRFGFKLFAEILKQDSKKNVFISPTSVALALSMTYNGANGATKADMAKALELQGLTLQDLNQANAKLKTLLSNPDPHVQLAIANSLWAKQGMTWQPDFLERNQRFYEAKVTELDFASPDAPGIINQWVKDNTKGKIDKIVDHLGPADVMVLINAIYFKGNWSVPFDKEQTETRQFNGLSGTRSRPMMSQTGEYQYLETTQFQAVSLPYGKNRRFSFYVFLPKKTWSLSQLANSLTAANWSSWMEGFRRRRGSVQIPRFKMEYGIELRAALSRLGMATAFQPKADFSGLSSESLYLDRVNHKTFVEVNEAGTEAAAVTSTTIRATAAMPMDEPFNMVVDRPFICAIRDNQTGTVLFIGSIVDPT